MMWCVQNFTKAERSWNGDGPSPDAQHYQFVERHKSSATVEVHKHFRQTSYQKVWLSNILQLCELTLNFVVIVISAEMLHVFVIALYLILSGARLLNSLTAFFLMLLLVFSPGFFIFWTCVFSICWYFDVLVLIFHFSPLFPSSQYYVLASLWYVI